MECVTVAGLADSWEKGELLDRRELEDARTHALSCPACRSRFGSLLELASRDSVDSRDVGGAGGAGGERATSSPAAEMLADRVMARLGADAMPDRRIVRRFRPGLRVLSAAAAALVVIASVGILVGRGGVDTTVVRFSLEAPEASSVLLAGNFSGWTSDGLNLERTGNGLWEIEIRLKRGRTYTYNFLVDGQSWVVDPSAADRIEDDFGGESALLRL